MAGVCATRNREINNLSSAASQNGITIKLIYLLTSSVEGAGGSSAVGAAAAGSLHETQSAAGLARRCRRESNGSFCRQLSVLSRPMRSRIIQ